MSGKSAKAARRAAAAAAPQKRPRIQSPKRREDTVAQRRRRLAVWAGVAAVVAVVGLYAIANVDRGGDGAPTAASGLQGSGQYVYAVGLPGPGEQAPPISLPSTTGKTFDLASYGGKQQVLLYFQEGLMCQPCWDQITAIERELPKFKALGVGQIASIVGDPLHLVEQKVADEGIKMPVLSDRNYRVSDAYDARTYGMMNGQMAGHSFILVGKDGRIVWRADYGGRPKYTMFVPTDVLLDHLRQGMRSAT